jgi:peroxiredoxin
MATKLLLLGFTVFAALFLALAGCKSTTPQPSLQLGDPAPDFTLPSAQGGAVSLSEFVGKTNVLLYFNMAYG